MLSSKLSVGVHILTLLAQPPGEPLTSEHIAGSVNTNPVVIRRLLGLLREAGYVESRGGVGGGWLMIEDPARIRLLDVLHAVEPDRETFALPRNQPNPACLVGRHIQGVLTDVYADVRKGIEEQLARTTVADILASVEGRAID